MKDIDQVLQTYFDASFEGSGDKVRAVFHPAARIYGVNPDASLSEFTREEFADLVSGHGGPPSPAIIERETEVIAVDYTGENAAAARVRLRLGDIMFTDVLCLVRLEGEWGIIAKMYSGEIR